MTELKPNPIFRLMLSLTDFAFLMPVLFLYSLMAVQPRRTSSYWTYSTGGFGINDPLVSLPHLVTIRER